MKSKQKLSKTSRVFEKFQLFFAAMVIAVFLSGCIVRGGLKGDGNVINQERTVADFGGIAVSGAANITIHQSEGYRVIVRTDSNIQDIIETKVENDSLNIGTKPGIPFRWGFSPTELTVEIYMPEIKNITVSGAANIKIADGKTSGLALNISGACKIDAEAYEVQNADITLSGAGDVRMWVTSALNYNVSGAGNVRYKGNPALNGKISGIGNISPL